MDEIRQDNLQEEMETIIIAEIPDFQCEKKGEKRDANEENESEENHPVKIQKSEDTQEPVAEFVSAAKAEETFSDNEEPEETSPAKEGKELDTPENSPTNDQKTAAENDKEEFAELTTRSSLDLKLVEEILINNTWLFSLTPLHKPYTLTLVDAGTPEYKKIETLVHEHGRSLSIRKLERVENPFLLAAYYIKKEEFKRKKMVFEEKLMFHGTSQKNVDNICKNNFDWRRRGQARGHKFGRGVSFTPDAWYAHHYSPSSLMFLARVLVSSCQIGMSCTLVPSEGFDTTKNSKDTVFVKYEDNEFYPHYIIHY